MYSYYTQTTPYKSCAALCGTKNTADTLYLTLCTATHLILYYTTGAVLLYMY